MKYRHIIALAVSVTTAGLAGASGTVDVEIPTTHWPGIFYETFDSVTSVIGLQSLREEGVHDRREVRVWIGGGSGYPQEMWRLLQTASGWEGDLILYWSLTSGGHSHGRGWRKTVKNDQRRWCDAPRTSKVMSVCHGDLPTQIDWSAIIEGLETQGLWDLPDPSELPPPEILVHDGSGITVELHLGNRYRSYQYSSPSAQRWQQATKAAEMERILSAVGPVARYDIDAYGRRIKGEDEE